MTREEMIAKYTRERQNASMNADFLEDIRNGRDVIRTYVRFVVRSITEQGFKVLEDVDGTFTWTYNDIGIMREGDECYKEACEYLKEVAEGLHIVSVWENPDILGQIQAHFRSIAFKRVTDDYKKVVGSVTDFFDKFQDRA